VYIAKLSLESELDPHDQYGNIDIIPGSLRKTNKAQLTFLRAPRVTKAGKLAKKSWRIVVIRQIRQSSFPSKVFYCTVYAYKIPCNAYPFSSWYISMCQS